MTLSQFNTDYEPIIRLILMIVGSIFVLVQLRLARKSLSENLKWNKINASFNFFDLEKNSNTGKTLYIKLREKNIVFDIKQPITEQVASSILDDAELNALVKQYLNDIEVFCTAIHYGAVDKELSYHLYKARFVRQYDIFINVIKKIRGGSNVASSTIFIEFEKIVKEWRKRLDEEESSHGVKAGV